MVETNKLRLWCTSDLEANHDYISDFSAVKLTLFCHNVWWFKWSFSNKLDLANARVRMHGLLVDGWSRCTDGQGLAPLGLHRGARSVFLSLCLWCLLDVPHRFACVLPSSFSFSFLLLCVLPFFSLSLFPFCLVLSLFVSVSAFVHICLSLPARIPACLLACLFVRFLVTELVCLIVSLLFCLFLSVCCSFVCFFPVFVACTSLRWIMMWLPKCLTPM